MVHPQSPFVYLRKRKLLLLMLALGHFFDAMQYSILMENSHEKGIHHPFQKT